MLKPAKSIDEVNRLSAVKDLDILDTPLNPAFERITRLAKKVMDVPMVAISIVDAERQWFKSEQGLNTCETSRDVSFCGHAILQDDFFVIPDALADDRFKDNPLVIAEDGPHIRFYAGYPIRSPEGYKIGSFCVMDTRARNITREELEPLKDMTALIEQQLYTSRQKQYQSRIMKELDQAKREKMIDTLTRVWNREGLEVNFREHTTHAKNHKEYLALTMIDIDDFKKINDTYGHNAGDQVLREITKRIVSSLDEHDILGRWGGEEFLGIIAMKCDNPASCIGIFEKVRQNIAREPVLYNGDSIKVTASFGVTYSRELEDDLTEIVAKADHALYQAKSNGKNMCVLEV